MKEYLRWFNKKMRIQGKHAPLLMDNFSAHELAIEQIEEANIPLMNTKVMQLLHIKQIEEMNANREY